MDIQTIYLRMIPSSSSSSNEKQVKTQKISQGCPQVLKYVVKLTTTKNKQANKK